MPFAEDATTAPPLPSGLFGMPLERSDFLHLAEIGLFGLLGVLALLLVLRPMVLRITTLAAPARLDSLPTLSSPYALPGTVPVVALAPPDRDAPGLLEDESMVNVAQIEGQIRASSIRRLSELADRHPDETLAIVRGWMVQETG